MLKLRLVLRRFSLVIAVCLWIPSVVAAVNAAGQPQVPAAPSRDASSLRPVVDRYCVGCHSARVKAAGIVLEGMDGAMVAHDPAVWEKVVRKLRSGAMPPQGLPRPDPATYDALAGWLETTLDRAALAQPNAGRPLVHRLNRAEYANAIRDLLALDIDPATLLPPDDSSYGFDNIADVLGTSPALLESYLTAAGKISALAVGSPAMGPSSQTFHVRGDASQMEHVEGLPLGTRGGLLVRPTFPLDGEYVVQGEAPADQPRIDPGHRVSGPARDRHRRRADASGAGRRRGRVRRRRPRTRPTWPMRIEARLQVRVQAEGRPARGRGDVPAEVFGAARQPPAVVPAEHAHRDRSHGPAAHRELLDHGPVQRDRVRRHAEPAAHLLLRSRCARQAKAACAENIIATLARRAFRRPVTTPEMGRLIAFYETGRSEGTFEHGIELALRAILASPKFAFRVESDPAQAAPGSTYRISDLELASRLSFFLWSSIPDDELARRSRRRAG